MRKREFPKNNTILVIELHMCVCVCLCLCVSSIHKTILIYFKNIVYIYIYIYPYLPTTYFPSYVYTYIYIYCALLFLLQSIICICIPQVYINLQGTPDVYYIFHILQVLCCPAFDERGILTRDAKQIILLILKAI